MLLPPEGDDRRAPCCSKGNTDCVAASWPGGPHERHFREFGKICNFLGFDVKNLKISGISKCSKLRHLKKHIQMY